jgi:hypothetical protein
VRGTVVAQTTSDSFPGAERNPPRGRPGSVVFAGLLSSRVVRRRERRHCLTSRRSPVRAGHRPLHTSPANRGASASERRWPVARWQPGIKQGSSSSIRRRRCERRSTPNAKRDAIRSGGGVGGIVGTVVDAVDVVDGVASPASIRASKSVIAAEEQLRLREPSVAQPEHEEVVRRIRRPAAGGPGRASVACSKPAGKRSRWASWPTSPAPRWTRSRGSGWRGATSPT